MQHFYGTTSYYISLSRLFADGGKGFKNETAREKIDLHATWIQNVAFMIKTFKFL